MRWRCRWRSCSPPLRSGLLSASTIEDEIGARAGLLAVGGALGVVCLLALAVLFYRRPALVVLLTIAALPFRIPVPTGHDDTANLLLPLYVVIAAACLAHLWRVLRGEPEAGELDHEDPRMRRLAQALALVVVVYALQALYSTDVEHAVKTIGFFYVPFAVLFRLLVEVRWTRRLLLQALAVVVGLALLFAAVGFAEWATGRLLISNEKVLAANDLKPYFRVNSLFFDPNVYGRFLALVMVVLAGVLLWAPARRDVVARRGRAGGAVGGAGADAVGVELRGAAGRPGRAGRAALEAVAGGGGVRRRRDRCAGGRRPGAGGGRPQDDSFSSVNEASSGRAKLIRGGAKMFGDRPLDGLRVGLLRRPLPRPRARRVLAAVGRVAHDPGHDRGRAGRDRARRLRLPAVDRARGRVRRAAADAAAAAGGGRAGRPLRRRGGVRRAAAAHLRLRGVPGGPADLDAARDGRGAAARGPGRRGGRAALAPGRAEPVPT